MQQVVAKKVIAALTTMLLICSSVGVSAVLGMAAPSKAYATTRTNVKLPKGVAATVNGKKIKEKTITAYVKKFRKDCDLASKKAWRKWAKRQKYTTKSIRLEVINYYVDQELYARAAKKYGVKVTKKDIKNGLKEVKDQFESDAAYRQALKSSNLTEKEYVATTLKPNLLKAKLASKLAKKGIIRSDSDKDFSKWFKKYRAKAAIKIAKMPKNLPYAL